MSTPFAFPSAATWVAAFVVLTSCGAETQGPPTSPQSPTTAASAPNPLADRSTRAGLLGRFAGDGLELHSRADGLGFAGELRLDGQAFSFRASAENGGLVGAFSHGGIEFPFRADPVANGLELETGGTRYALRPVEPVAPTTVAAIAPPTAAAVEVAAESPRAISTRGDEPARPAPAEQRPSVPEPGFAPSMGARWLWNGTFAAGTGLVSVELGAGFVVPPDFQASYAWENNCVSLSSSDGELKGTVWLVSSIDRAAAESWIAPTDWRDRAGEPMTSRGLVRTGEGRAEAVAASAQDLLLGSLAAGPGQAAVMVFLWGAPQHEARLRAASRAVLASVVHTPPSRTAQGHFALCWLGRLNGTKLVKYESYTSTFDSGYAAQWRIDLCWDGTFSQSDSYSASFGALGSAASFDPKRGVWGLEAHDANRATLLMQAQGGNLVRYDVRFDPASQRTFLGNVRYFRVPNERCEPPPQEPALPPELVQLLGVDAGGGAPSSAPSSATAPGSAPGTAPAAGASALDGVWLAEAEGLALELAGARYALHVFDGISEWDPADAGALEHVAGELVFRSDDGDEAERHTYSLNGDVFVLHWTPRVTFRRQDAR